MSYWEKALSLPKSLDDYVDARNRAVETIKSIFFMRNQADKDLANLGWEISIPLDIYGRMREPEAIKNLDRRFWKKCFDMTGLLSIMDAREKEKFFDSLEKDVPAFSIENINSTYATILQDAEMMFSRGIVNIFSRLSDDYKTNSKEPFKVGEKIILNGVFMSYEGKIETSYSSWAHGMLNDIDRVFNVLDGKKHSPRALEFAINKAFKESNTYDDEYFHIKGFKNGNAHIKVKQINLLDDVNRLISKFFHGKALV